MAPSAVNAIATQGGASAMKVLVNNELQNQDGAECLRPFDPAYRGRTACRPDLSRRRSPQRRPAQRPDAGRSRGAPLRLPAGRPDPLADRRRTPRAIAGRRSRLGRPAAHGVRRAAAGRNAQADPDHVGADALPGDQAEAARLCRRGRGLRRALPHAKSWTSANRCSTCWRSIRPANCRSTPIWKC